MTIVIDGLVLVGYIYNQRLNEECECAKEEARTSREPMIHIRLDKTTHRQFKVRVAQIDTTIQHLVADLIRREVGGEST